MKAPRLISDLYADLRDRKLLPLVIVLPLAIVAVPLLLKQDPAPPVPAPATAAEDVPEGVPTAAVLTSAPTLRDYRERLDKLRRKNPFAGDPSGSESTPAEGEIVETTVPGSSGGGGSASFSETFDQAVSQSSSTDSTQTDVVVNGGGGGGGGGGLGGDGDPEDVNDSGDGGQWYQFQLDVETGPAGDTNRRNNLTTLTVLPSQSNPVAVYLGIAKGGKKAVFMVSPDVVGLSGGGSCSPSPSNCQLLSLGEGEEEKFDYAPTGEPDTFVIEVKDIRFVPVKNPVNDPRDAGTVAAGAPLYFGD